MNTKIEKQGISASHSRLFSRLIEMSRTLGCAFTVSEKAHGRLTIVPKIPTWVSSSTRHTVDRNKLDRMIGIDAVLDRRRVQAREKIDTAVVPEDFAIGVHRTRPFALTPDEDRRMPAGTRPHDARHARYFGATFPARHTKV